MLLDGRAIAEATGGTLLRDAPAGPVWTDTRTLPEGAWFLALVGDRFDGHGFLDRASDMISRLVQTRPVTGHTIRTVRAGRASTGHVHHRRRWLPPRL